MPARRPEELDQLLAEALNSGDLDALVALYEPQASMASSEPGQIASGLSAIREAMSGFLAMRPKITLEVQTIAQAEDIAMTTARWHLTATGPDGNPMELDGQGVEVARRQADGTWLFVIDSPFGLVWSS